MSLLLLRRLFRGVRTRTASRSLLLPVLLSLAAASLVQAQAQYAGTYIGTFNTRQGAAGVFVELPSTGYIATVTAAGAINVNSGALVGTVSATGAVTFTSGFELAALGITKATISSNKLSSAYGAKVANGVAEWRFNASTSFTPAAGGGGGGGGGDGGGGGGGGGTALPGALYRFDGNLADVVGSTAATIGGGVTYDTGVSGQAARFNGTNGYLSLGSANLVSDQGPFSVSFWFKPTSAQIMVPIRLKTAGTEFATRIGLNASDSTSHGASIYFGFRGGAGIISRDPRFFVQSTLNQWVHLTFVYKGGSKTSANSFDLLVNGERLPLTTSGTVGGSANANEIGRDGGGGSYVAGLIDDVRITSTALSVSDSAAAYAAAPALTGVTTAPSTFVGYRNKVNQTFEFVVTGSSSGSVWGTDIYTDDSNVASAAVHAGVVAPGETKTVSVTILPGKSSYAASTRNGVASRSWGGWTGSYSFAGAAGATGTATAAPSLVNSPPALTHTSIGGRLSLSVTVGGVGPFTYQWYRNGTMIEGAVGAAYTLASASASDAGTYTVRATNAAGTTTINAGTVTVGAAGAPAITLQPLSKTVAPGTRFSLLVSALGSNLTYQWRKDGVAIPGATQHVFETAAVPAAAGSYTCAIGNAAGSVITAPAIIAVSPDASRPANISCRTNIAAGQIVTPGFYVAGTGTKRVLIRAVGPGLVPYGLTGVMADPKLVVYRGQTKIAENDTWDPTLTATFTATGAFGLQSGSKDAALVATLPAGEGYTVQVSGNAGSSGIALIEVYDADSPATATSRLVNVSVRGQSGTGDQVLILGFVLGGTGQRTLLVRGIGPKLASYGVTGALADPSLEIFDANSRSVLDNDDWGQAPFVAEQMLAAGYVGAFSLDAGSADAATLALLDPGAYTVQVRGAEGSTGETLVEVYEVP